MNAVEMTSDAFAMPGVPSSPSSVPFVGRMSRIYVKVQERGAAVPREMTLPPFSNSPQCEEHCS
jgi:hypothetical protein